MQIGLAAEYLRVRALGQAALPTALVCQSAFLAQQDPVAPSAVGVVATLVAVAGHFLLIERLGWGLTGERARHLGVEKCGGRSAGGVACWRPLPVLCC
eukprot:270133-Chlamydomonas_euryale.AAC.2